ncbi:MAG: MoaD/ThiS family protein [Sulfolobales archaeon]|nr:MoaD/ThiS family protein [Sulfolobales archaeon]MCX8209254.1 MoaD/ThiS family protein [Sulfolobales archaeon]MDW8011142.1 MoaD/ThiS family protein [Sulfolobales archaeon]
MKLKIRVYMELAAKVGWREREVHVPGNSCTLRDLLESIEEFKGLLDESFTERFVVLVNGVNARLRGGLEATISDGDTLDIFPPAGGG